MSRLSAVFLIAVTAAVVSTALTVTPSSPNVTRKIVPPSTYPDLLTVINRYLKAHRATKTARELLYATEDEVPKGGLFFGLPRKMYNVFLVDDYFNPYVWGFELYQGEFGLPTLARDVLHSPNYPQVKSLLKNGDVAGAQKLFQDSFMTAG